MGFSLTPATTPFYSIFGPSNHRMAGLKKALIVFLLFTAPVFSIAQSQSLYPFQKDDTALNRKLYDISVLKKKALVSNLGKDNKSTYEEIYESRLENIKSLLLSRRTVTDAMAHGYLQSVVNKIIAANPELKDIDVRVVFTRDWWPNAYSMGDGTIAFNAGLLVFMDNEAELAYVLCHELAHYYLDHSGKAISKYVNTVNSDEYQKELKRLSKQEYGVNQELEKLAKKVVFDARRHSRENEAEADRQALRFLKRTGYDGLAMKTALQMLDKVDDSSLFRPLVLDKLFSFTEYAFKPKWTRKESQIFGAMGDDDGSGLTKKEKDSLKTHPDCSRRIALLEDSMAAIKGKNFLVDEKMFRKLKTDFVAEITENCFEGGNLGRNLYYSLQLLQDEKYKPLAVVSVMRCLNTLYSKQKEHKLGLAVDAESRYYPEDYNLLLRMLTRVRLDEIAALSYHFGLSYQSEMKNNEDFEKELATAKKLLNQ